MLKLKAWNSTVPTRVDRCVHELISEQCRTAPDAPAVCAWDGNFTYRELDHLSTALAVHLAGYGVGPEMFVLLCFEKSCQVAVAVLGVLKVGAAFVLLDPNQPQSRLQELCASVHAKLVLSSAANHRCSQKLAETVVVLSSMTELPFPDLNSAHFTSVAKPYNAAYASFTSGSTGTPKAVVVEHSAYCSNALAHSNRLQFNKHSRILQSGSYAFGASILQLVTTLIVGGCVCVPSESECRNDIVAAATKLQANWALFTPSFFRVVRHMDMPSLKHVVLGGEPLARDETTGPPDHVQVIIAYGSAECSVICAVTEGVGSSSSPQGIGNMAGGVGWIVEPDNHHKLVPLGAIGELLVEGPILARGYLDDVEKTATAFIEAPTWFSEFCEKYNQTLGRSRRMYKTGDLVRYNADGSLVFVGRKDTQVKIRGQRVELSEVEHHIRQTLAGDINLPVVAETVTLRGGNHSVLVAFIAIGEVANEAPSRVRAALEQRLQGVENRLMERVPRYVVPSAYLAVDSIPMTVTGKTDRRRLRELGETLKLEQLTELQLFRSKVRAPMTALERQLQELWACVLSLPHERIGADDSFLRIGGDSITAVQLVAAAREEGLSLSVADIFNTPCLSEMARVVKAGSCIEKPIAPFSLLQSGLDVGMVRNQVAVQCGVDMDHVEDVFPCTPLQEGMLTITAKQPGDYVCQIALELQSHVDIGRLEQAWQEVITTLPILRTRIVDLAGQGLVQVAIAEQGLIVTRQDLNAYLEAGSQETMSLGTPLARFAIIDCPGSSQRPVFVWTVHHALVDGWSLPLVLKQVEQAYHGCPRDRLVPFQGYIKHILQNGATTIAAKEYWQSQLGGCQLMPFPSLPWPGYQPRADEVLQHQISGLRWPRNGITAATVVRAAWAILLAHYTKADAPDVVFGATVTGRQGAVAGVERMAGPTIATVPVRVAWSWGEDIQVLLQRVQTQANSMTAYEHMGLQHIRRISADTQQGCQFQTLLVIQPPAHGSGANGTSLFSKGPRLDATGDEYARKLKIFNPYTILVECGLGVDGVQVRVSYDSKVVPKVQVQRLAGHLEHLLRELCLDRTGRISVEEVGGLLLGPEDRRQLQAWNGKVPARVDQCVHRLIQERCQGQPTAQAVCAWDGDFTYDELDTQSSALAVYLAAQGVGPGVFVPLYFEKSRWITVAILGVMKAGGAFILLDPAHPAARQQEICHAVSAKLIISSAAQAATAGDLAAQVVVVAIDAITLWTNSNSTGWESSAVTPDHALYAVFTSGSTGTPKGLVIPHAAFATSILAHRQVFGLTAESRVFQFSSYAFDASIIEILATLSVGGCICIPSDASRRNDIARAATQLRVNWAQLTPSVARLVQVEDVMTLKTLVLVGEPVSVADIESWDGHVTLVNGYGPAECSAISTVRPRMTKSDAYSIGWAVGCVCWVVDCNEHERLVPIGEVGELLIEGPIVGHGYLNNPEQTAAAFINPPSWLYGFRPGCQAEDLGLLYKTGDLVQYMGDGSLKFIKRKDTQAKIRGQRIELGEVEHHTRQCFPRARDVVAEVVTPMGPGRPPLLVAFVWEDVGDSLKAKLQGTAKTSEGSVEHDADELLAAPTDAFRVAVSEAEAALHDAVPAYMVPALFLPIMAIPLTATGKIDRRRLRDHAEALSRAELEVYHSTAMATRGPSTPAEHILQQFWAKVLNIEPGSIGADDSFFRLGGDSITAMQLSAQLRGAGFSCSVADIFHTKTISRLASALAHGHQILLDTAELVDTVFELSPIQRLFFVFNEDGPNHFNQSFLLPVAGRLARDDLARALDVLVRNHSMLRARFRRAEDGQWSQMISTQIDRSYRYQYWTVARLEDARGIISTSQRSLDLRNGPLFAADLIDINGAEQYLFLVAHHLVIDLVSWRIILGDLEELLKTGQLSAVKTLPFQTWCRLQAKYSSEHLNPSAALPSTIPPAVQDYWGPVWYQNSNGNTIRGSFTLSEELTTVLFGAANDALQTQPVEIFQAALWHSFVQAFPDRPLPTIFNEGHGREPWDSSIDLSRTVGWFTTIWPTCLGTDGGEIGIVDIVRRTKDTRRWTPSNGWAYFACRFLNPDGRTAFDTRGPVEIAFNYLGLYQQLERQGSILRPPVKLEDHPSDAAGNVQRFALIDVSATVERGRLQFLFCYNKYMQHQDAIVRWMANCERSLQDAVQQLSSLDPTYTLYDFPLLPLTYNSLDRLLNKTLPQIGMLGRDVGGAYPCSPMQRGILLSQAKDARLYWPRFIWKVVPSSIPGAVDMGRLQHAWQQVVDRHAILRTVFVDSGNEGYATQVVRRLTTANTAVVECVNNDPITSLKKHPRALGQAGQPPHRLLLCVTPTEAFCALEISHALIDAHSSRILQRDLRLSYDHRLPKEPGTPYEEYIKYLCGLPEVAAETYWRSYIEGVQPCHLPTLQGLGAGNQQHKELRLTSVHLGAGERFYKFCQEHEVTLSNLFQVAWGLVLQAYTGAKTACFGYLNSGRDISVRGVHDIVGPLINMLVCRIAADSNISVLAMLKKNHTDYLQSLPYQHYSLAGILHLAGMTGGSLFNTIMSFQRLTDERGEQGSSIQIEGIGGEDPTEYDISVTIGISDRDIRIMLQYWSTSLGDRQVADIASTFRHIVNVIIDYPDLTPSQLEVVSAEDCHQLQEWNRDLPERVDRCVHELIAEQCHAQPDAPAVCAWDGNFTYSELDARSSVLAVYLAACGVGPEVFVPLYFEKSRWTIVAILAVIKAGGAFILLDLAHPVARQQKICRAVSAKLVIASVSQAATAGGLASRVIMVGDNSIDWQEKHTIWKHSPVTPKNTLYAVFTSGSTGTPKGAIISHAAFSVSATSHGPRLHLTPKARVLQFVSYGFDVSISDTLTTLISGACICVPSLAEKENVAMAINKYMATWAHLTPSIIKTLEPHTVPGLEVLALIGEPITKSDIEIWGPHVQLINSYGPAECAVVSTVQTHLESASDVGNIGWAVGCICWIVDRENHERLVPIGVVGELLIEGPIIGRGYLNPEQTAAAFIDPPLWLHSFRRDCQPADLGRLYKTGDLVQYTADGSLRFIGRKDTQVKLRGQRIELGEVEYYTRHCFAGAHDVVAEVVAPAEAGRPPMLVAFVRGDGLHQEPEGQNCDTAAPNEILASPTDVFRAAIPIAEAALHDVVPAYMVPALFLPIVAVPLTATGKTDRRRLRDRAAALSRTEIEAYYPGAVKSKRYPTTAVERTLQHLWGKVLNIPSHTIGMDDSFFRLGGDSITALRLAGAARSSGLDLSTAHLFQCPTLSQQTSLISCSSPDVALATAPGPLPLLDEDVPDSASFRQLAAVNGGAHMT
ncbi:nonribosomal peptide synthase [Aspergillus niger]|nr:nonribosomal peptide synthase [Aspergillus niger]